MQLQKDMIAEHFELLAHAEENHTPVVYTFVPGNLTELIRSFGALPVLPEINALQSGMRKQSADYIAEAERIAPQEPSSPSRISSCSHTPAATPS